MTTYKYRIVAVEPDRYKAQYKTFLIWWNLSHTDCNYGGCSSEVKYFKTVEDAEEAIKTSIRIWCGEENYDKNVKENYPKVLISGRVDC